MSDALDDLLFSTPRTPAEEAALRAAFEADPELRDHVRRWEAICSALRDRLEGAVPDRSLLVLHALDDLGEQLTEEERATLRSTRRDLEAAFAAHPALEDVIRQMQAECRAFDAVWTAHAAEPAPSRPAASPDRRPARHTGRHTGRHRPLRWAMRTGVGLALVAFVAVAVLVLQRDRGLVTVEAETTTTITLAGGSTVRLVPGARLTYPDPDVEAALRRPLHLEGGAFFDVAPQPVPLVVETPTARATVLGTRFGVRADAAMTEVVLVSGQVRLAAADVPERPVTLAPGEVSRVAAGALPTTPAPVDVTEALSWTALLVFQAAPAAALAERLADHYGVPVAVAPVLAAEPVTGTFERTQPLPAVLEAVAATLGGEVLADGDGYRIE